MQSSGFPTAHPLYDSFIDPWTDSNIRPGKSNLQGAASCRYGRQMAVSCSKIHSCPSKYNGSIIAEREFGFLDTFNISFYKTKEKGSRHGEPDTFFYYPATLDFGTRVDFKIYMTALSLSLNILFLFSLSGGRWKMLITIDWFASIRRPKWSHNKWSTLFQ